MQLEQFKRIGGEIATFVDEPLQQTERMLVPWRGTRFVVCGTSGSGKTRALSYANQLLPENAQIAESLDILRVHDTSSAIEIIRDPGLAYERSLHIAFTVCDKGMGKDLESHGIKVFWLDRGTNWRDAGN